ncbi:MAG: hypothetical protein KBG21_11195 [Ignavibacteria bacterium]|nr:hypothetical protein [Ignavibacteria bacterium]
MFDTLPRKFQSQLLSLPETGMGYQLVELDFRKKISNEDRFFKAIVFNSSKYEILSNDDTEIKYGGISKRFLRVRDSFIHEFLNENEYELNSIKSLPIENLKISDKSVEYNGGAVDSPLQDTQSEEIFVRFSAFPDDTRVNFSDKSLIAGTFATTYKDAKYCLDNKLNINDGYALPNDLEIKYYYIIKPKSGTSIQRGIVQPAFGKTGGGEEVFFPTGTSSNTVEGPIDITVPI